MRTRQDRSETSAEADEDHRSADECIASGRPKRNASSLAANKDGWFVCWKEEEDLRRAIRASLISADKPNKRMRFDAVGPKRQLMLKDDDVGKDELNGVNNAAQSDATTTSSATTREGGQNGYLAAEPSSTEAASVHVGSKRSAKTDYPATEDFISFLCLRGTDLLPPELEIFERMACRKPTTATALMKASDKVGNSVLRTLKKRDALLNTSPSAKARNRLTSTSSNKTLATKLKSKATKFLTSKQKTRFNTSSMGGDRRSSESSQQSRITTTTLRISGKSMENPRAENDISVFTKLSDRRRSLKITALRGTLRTSVSRR